MDEARTTLAMLWEPVREVSIYPPFKVGDLSPHKLAYYHLH